jgi:hypothetical protein
VAMFSTQVSKVQFELVGVSPLEVVFVWIVEIRPTSLQNIFGKLDALIRDLPAQIPQ